MKINYHSIAVRPVSALPAGRTDAVKMLLLFCSLLACVFSGRAQQSLVWDANAGTGANDGNGYWVSPNAWWSLTGGTNYTWSGGGDQSSVTFGAGSGPVGTYIVSNNLALTQPTNISFVTPGSYIITTDGTNVGEVQWVAVAGGVGTASKGLWVGTNVTAQIDVPWRNVNGSDIFLGSNSVLTISQSSVANQGSSLIFKGSGSAVSTVNATNGTWGGPTGTYLSGTMLVAGVTLNIINSAVINAGTRFDIARSGITGAPATDAIINVGNGGQLNANATAGSNSGNHLQVSRGSPATLNILSGGSVSTLKDSAGIAGNLRITPDSSSRGIVNMSGGVLKVGIGMGGTPGYANSSLTPITFYDATTPGSTAQAILNVSGGVIGSKAIIIGNGSAFTANATNQINITGGTIYLDAANISINTPAGTSGTNYAFNLSGGTIAATANWSPACKVPINLTNVNGNATFQAADAGGAAQNISLSGSLTGVGGLIKTGAGVLTLSGTNTYTGSTVVSNGTLAVSTLYSPVNGSVVVEGSTLSTVVANVGQHWSVSSLTYDTGTPVTDFNYGNFSPSATVAPVQINGNLAYNVTPQVTVEGSAIPAGIYPLITYTGTLSGTPPTTVAITGSSASGYVTNYTATKTVALVVSVSGYVPALSWGIGNGSWDFTDLNWKQSGNAVSYTDGSATLFDDTASGTSPITVTLNATVNPNSITVNNTAKNYVIAGSGAIAGGTGLIKDGAGTLTLSGANTYTGGTTLNAGQLNLNYGGNGTASSAIGTGPLTINLGAVIDNTSGQAITLLTPITQNWADDFVFVGSTNLNLGIGAVNLGSGNVALTVSSNTLEVDGSITDNGHGYGLTKSGNGTLILSNYNNFAGGLTLSSGTLDLNTGGADGTGLFTISGGILDNTSGNTVNTGSSGIKWQNNFTFNGSGSLDFGSAPVNMGQITMTINSNTIYTEGTINGANNTLTKNGAGTWTISGSTANSAFGLVINSGLVNFNKDFLWYALPSNPVTVNTNGILNIMNANGTQFGPTASIVLSGGLVELNGDNGEIFQSITFNSGILQNSGGSALLILSSSVSLAGTNCDFNLTNNSALTINGVISNTGSLLLTGNGTLTTTNDNTYSGNTTIAGGTLALVGGSISNSVIINVRASGTLDVSGRTDQTLTLKAGQSLTGKGTINGSLVGSPGSTVAPGGALTTGTLTVNNNAMVNGNLLLNLNDTNTPTSSQLVANGGPVTYAGTLTVTNTGRVLTVGESFQLFPSAVTTFAAINLPATDASGNGYTWVNHVAVDGSIQVQSVGPAINPLPGPIQFNLSGNTLSLSWPTNLGWILQEQTNSLTVGLGTNWVTVPGSSSVTSTNITVNPANGSAFFRLMKP